MDVEPVAPGDVVEITIYAGRRYVLRVSTVTSGTITGTMSTVPGDEGTRMDGIPFTSSIPYLGEPWTATFVRPGEFVHTGEITRLSAHSRPEGDPS